MGVFLYIVSYFYKHLNVNIYNTLFNILKIFMFIFKNVFILWFFLSFFYKHLNGNSQVLFNILNILVYI